MGFEYQPGPNVFEPETGETTSQQSLPEQLEEIDYGYDGYWLAVSETEPNIHHQATSNYQDVNRRLGNIDSERLPGNDNARIDYIDRTYRKLGSFNLLSGAEDTLLSMSQELPDTEEADLLQASLIHERARLLGDPDLLGEAREKYKAILQPDHHSEPETKQRAFQQLWDSEFLKHHWQTQDVIAKYGKESDQYQKQREVFAKMLAAQTNQASKFAELRSGDIGAYLELVAPVIARYTMLDKDALGTTYARTAFLREDEPFDNLAHDERAHKHSFDQVHEHFSEDGQLQSRVFEQLKANPNAVQYDDYIPGIEIPDHGYRTHGELRQFLKASLTAIENRLKRGELPAGGRAALKEAEEVFAGDVA